MLQAIRDRVMGIVGWIILGFLFVAFAFFGLDSYLTSTGDNFAAKVNDTEINPTLYQRTYEQLTARMRQALGDNYDPALIDDALIKKNALKKLINEELIQQAAAEAGLSASENMLASKIADVDDFKKDGVFSKERYAKILGYQGMTPSQFEWMLKQELEANQLKAGIILTATGTEDYLRKAYALQGQMRRFNYIVIPKSSVEAEVTVSEDDISKYYNEHPEQFKTPERLKLQYVELNADEIQVPGTVDDAQIKALYEENHDRYVVPEQRHARHILIAIKDATPEADEAARNEAESAIGRLEKGEDFAAVAAELSADTASAKTGGDLGTFGRGVMVPEVEQAVFNLKVGERSAPVKSQFGYHIIELLGIEPEVVTPMSEVRAELVNELQHDSRANAFVEKSEMLANLAFEQPDSLQGVADSLGLRIVDTDWVTRSGGNGIAANQKVVDAAFSDDVLKGGNNSQPVEVDTDHLLVLRVTEHEQSALPPLAEIHDQVAAVVHQEMIDRKLTERGKTLLAALQSGAATMDSVSRDNNLKLDYNILLARTARHPTAALVSRSFTLPRPETGKSVFDGSLQPEGYVLLSLEEVQDGKYDDLPEASRKQAWRSLNELMGTNEMQMVLSELESRATIKIPATSSE